MNREDTIKTLITAWNARDAGERQRIVSKSLADDFYYSDAHQNEPLHGKRAFLDFLNLQHRRMNGVTTALDGAIQCHHSHAHFNVARKEKGQCVARGTYVADFTEGGRVQRLVGFDGV